MTEIQGKSILVRVLIAKVRVMHQSIPAAPSPFPYKTPPPPLFSQPDPQALAFFFCLGWQIPGGGAEKKRSNGLSSVNAATFFIDHTVK